jgi:hypothetical protein
MTTAVATGTSAAALALAAPPPADSLAAPPLVPGLPDPTASAEPLDPLAMLLVSMEANNAATMKTTQARIDGAREKLDAHLEKLLKQLEDHDHGHKRRKGLGGLLKNAVSDVADVGAKVIGTVADVTKDAAWMPVDNAISVFKHLDDPQAMLNSLKADFAQLGEKSEYQKAVEQAVSGGARFATDLLAFQATALLAMSENAVRGDPLADAVQAQGRELWDSFNSNIVENDGLWQVAGGLAKAAALTATVLSGGALAPVAVGIFVLLEADARYGFIDEAGDAAPYVRMGLQFALAACTAGSGGANSTANALTRGAQVMTAASTMRDAVHGLNEGLANAAERRRAADVQATMNRMAQLQRLVETLISDLKEHGENRTRTEELGSAAIQARDGASAAAVFRA